MTTCFAIFISCLAVLTSTVQAADECEQFPAELNMSLEQCCQFPNVSDPETDKKIQETIKESVSNTKNNYLMACKVSQTIFSSMNLLKDKKVDKDLYIKFIDKKVPQDSDFWKQPLKDAFDVCQKTLMADMSKITDTFSKPPFNIKKDDCDAQYLIMFMCLHLDSFVNCPDKAWKSTEKDSNYKTCTSVKSWIGKCGKDLSALQKVVAGASPKSSA